MSHGRPGAGGERASQPIAKGVELGAMPRRRLRQVCAGRMFWEGGGGMTVPLSDFIMSEIDLLKRSSFEWCDILAMGRRWSRMA